MKQYLIDNLLTVNNFITNKNIQKLPKNVYDDIIKLTIFCPIDTSIFIRIKFILNDIKEYPKCAMCQKLVKMHFRKKSLLETCSEVCEKIKRVDSNKKSTLINYGVESTNALPEVKEKMKNTFVSKYGKNSYVETKEFTKKSKNSKLIKFGNEKYVNAKKAMSTKLYLYGDEKYNNGIKRKKTCLEKYGFEHHMQNIDIFIKQQHSAYRMKTYKNIKYRGSYELLFLKLCNKLKIIENLEAVFPIKYKYDDKIKIYFPDFILNLKNVRYIIEIKSEWTYDNCGKNLKLRMKNDTKFKAAKKCKNYKFISILCKSDIEKEIKRLINI